MRALSVVVARLTARLVRHPSVLVIVRVNVVSVSRRLLSLVSSISRDSQTIARTKALGPSDGDLLLCLCLRPLRLCGIALGIGLGALGPQLVALSVLAEPRSLFTARFGLPTTTKTHHHKRRGQQHNCCHHHDDNRRCTHQCHTFSIWCYVPTRSAP